MFAGAITATNSKGLINRAIREAAIEVCLATTALLVTYAEGDATKSGIALFLKRSHPPPSPLRWV